LTLITREVCSPSITKKTCLIPATADPTKAKPATIKLYTLTSLIDYSLNPVATNFSSETTILPMNAPIKGKVKASQIVSRDAVIKRAFF